MSDGSDTIDGAGDGDLGSRGQGPYDDAILAQLAEALLQMPPARNSNPRPDSNDTEYEWPTWQGPARRLPDVADNVRSIEGYRHHKDIDDLTSEAGEAMDAAPAEDGKVSPIPRLLAVLFLVVTVGVLVGAIVAGVWLLVASDPGIF